MVLRKINRNGSTIEFEIVKYTDITDIILKCLDSDELSICDMLYDSFGDLINKFSYNYTPSYEPKKYIDIDMSVYVLKDDNSQITISDFKSKLNKQVELFNDKSKQVDPDSTGNEIVGETATIGDKSYILVESTYNNEELSMFDRSLYQDARECKLIQVDIANDNENIEEYYSFHIKFRHTADDAYSLISI